jgi:hypothetical protein
MDSGSSTILELPVTTKSPLTTNSPLPSPLTSNSPLPSPQSGNSSVNSDTGNSSVNSDTGNSNTWQSMASEDVYARNLQDIQALRANIREIVIPEIPGYNAEIKSKADVDDTIRRLEEIKIPTEAEIHAEIPKTSNEEANSNESSNESSSRNESTIMNYAPIAENLATVSTMMDTINTANDVLVETVATIAAKQAINLERTEDASVRAKSIRKRAEEFLSSFPSPGKIALYAAMGLATGTLLWYIVRYRELPFAGIFRSFLATGPDITMNAAPINIHQAPITINFPNVPAPTLPTTLPLPNSSTLPLPNSSTFSTAVSHWGLTVGIVIVVAKVAVTYFLRHPPKI